jgi:Family of unknown function (DUF5691)
VSLDLSELAAASLRGTARSGLPAPLPTPLGRSLARVVAPTPESTLLLRAGLAGLHALAGQPPAQAAAEADPVLPPGPRPAPPALAELLPELAEHLNVLTELIDFLAAAGQTLGPREFWLLRDSRLPVKLWDVLDERARWLAHQNPAWRGLDPGRYSKDVRVRLLRAEVLESHAAEPERVAAELLTRWPDFRADERRAVLEGIAASLHPADLPLLALAQSDKLKDVQKIARQLAAHLPGEIQDSVIAALKASVKVSSKGTPKFLAVDLPAVLGSLDLKDMYDTATARLVGALPFPVLLSALGVTPAGLLSGIRNDPGYSMTAELVGTLRGDLTLEVARQVHPSLDMDHWPQVRIRRLAQGALAALDPEAPDADLTGLLAALLSALDEPLALTGPEQARLHRLTGTLLTELSAESASESSQEYAVRLITQVGFHLNPGLPLWPAPDLTPPEPLPENAKKDVQGRYNSRLYLLARVNLAYTELNQVLTLRRRVAEVMGQTG